MHCALMTCADLAYDCNVNKINTFNSNELEDYA